MTRKKQMLFILSLAIILTSLATLVHAARFGVRQVRAFAPNTDVGGIIATDTTWDLAGSPYVMTSIVTVNPGVTLTIEPGVTVQGVNGTVLIVEGDLQAVGHRRAAHPFHLQHEHRSFPMEWDRHRWRHRHPGTHHPPLCGQFHQCIQL